MNARLLATPVAIVGLAFVPPAAADNPLADITWVPQFGIQYKYLDFDQNITTTSGSRVKIDGGADLPSLSVGLAAIYKKAYVSFKYEDSYGDNVADSSGSVPIAKAPVKTDREDYSATIGYNVWDSFNLFTGYLVGEIKLTPMPLCPLVVDQQNPECNDFSFGIGAGNQAQYHYVNGLGEYQQTYREDGWFVGASYAWQFFETGTLALSLGYAWLDSRFTDNFIGKGSSYNVDAQGDASGFSYGVRWSQPIGRYLGYYLDVRTQSYEANTEVEKGFSAGYKIDTDETMTTLSAGLQWTL